MKNALNLTSTKLNDLALISAIQVLVPFFSFSCMTGGAPLVSTPKPPLADRKPPNQPINQREFSEPDLIYPAPTS